MWQWKEEAMLCEIHMRDFKSHFWWYFLAYCTRPVSVHLAMACVCCSFTSFSTFLLSVTVKQQQNLMKIMFSCIHLPVWPYPPKIMKKMYFILVNCIGWQVFSCENRCFPQHLEWIIARPEQMCQTKVWNRNDCQRSKTRSEHTKDLKGRYLFRRDKNSRFSG